MRKALSLLGDEPFAVLNGDMLTYIPLLEVMEQHRRERSDITLVILKSERFFGYSSLFFEESSSGPPRLCGFHPGKGEPYHYSGLQIVNPEIARLIPSDQKTEIFNEIYPALIQEKRIHGFVYDGFWMEIGTLRQYLRTSLDLSVQPLPVALQPPGMEPSPVSPEALVEQGAHVVDSIVMQGAIIQSGSVVERSIVGRDVRLHGHYRDAALVRGLLPWYIRNEHHRPAHHADRL
jgi:mannose-1-phosphate guanylyltransferase/phosphomannomutase